MYELTGKVALVTGAGTGMGVGIATTLAAQGALVAVNDLDPATARSTADAIEAQGGRALAVPFDVTDRGQVEEAVVKISATLGPVDILVNNAGVPSGMALAKFRDLEPEAWDKYIDLNLYGSLYCVKAVVDGMCERGWGRIIQISSGAGSQGLRIGVSLYGASKSGIEGFVRHLSQEVARDGVTVNTVALGLMTTKTGDLDPSLEALAHQVPVGRLGTPTDVGAFTAFLASDEAAWITGQTMNLNGGSTTT